MISEEQKNRLQKVAKNTINIVQKIETEKDRFQKRIGAFSIDISSCLSSLGDLYFVYQKRMNRLEIRLNNQTATYFELKGIDSIFPIIGGPDKKMFYSYKEFEEGIINYLEGVQFIEFVKETVPGSRFTTNDENPDNLNDPTIKPLTAWSCSRTTFV